MKSDRPYPGTQSVVRAITILKAFRDDQTQWGLTDLAQALGLNKTTTYRLLTALAREGMVSHDEQANVYRLGPETIVLGGRALRANNLRAVSHPELVSLAAAVQETAALELLTGAEVLVLDEVIGDRVMSGTQEIGTRWPAYATSTGKAILAYLPVAALATLLPQSLPALTPNTLPTLDALQEDLAQVRDRGYAISDGELEVGLRAVAAPLRNYDGEAVAAISLAGPAVRLTWGRLPAIGQLVREAAHRISVQLGFPPAVGDQ